MNPPTPKIARISKSTNKKHELSFDDAKFTFSDENRIIREDIKHSTDGEARYLCIGKVGEKIATVVFARRGNNIRIISAGFYRKERRFYENR